MHLVQSFLAYFVENALNVIAIIVVVGSHITKMKEHDVQEDRKGINQSHSEIWR